jgi:phage replication O-like protein O
MLPKQDQRQPNKPFTFEGFAMPHYTQEPDELFDSLMPHLSGAELKVLLYIIRRTFGFKKQMDSISLSQMVSGIQTKAGEILDTGTGLGKSSVARALNKLEEMNIIIRIRSQSSGRGDEPTTYALKMCKPVSQNGTPPSAKIGLPVSRQRDTQQTAEQQTDKQQAALVAALLNFGIDKPTVDRLVKKHDGQHITQKIDYVRFMQQEQPDQVRNPRGWLLKAIEQDYGPPAG